MQVIKAKSAGFCMGVNLAVRKLERAVDALDGGGGLYTIGPIIHNPALVANFEKRGARCLNDYHAAESGSTVVIRAHGLPRSVELELKDKCLQIIDATCPKVKAAQLTIQKTREAQNATLLLFGEKDHPEVQGLISYAQGDAIVFNNLAELEKLPLDPAKNYFVAAQTTQDQEIFTQVLELLEKKLGRRITALDTICDATSQRQADVIELAGKVKSMVIVGGLNSGNTRRLAEIARGRGLFTVHCESPDELPLEELRALQPIGLSAGASTPEEQILGIETVLIKA